MPEYFRCTLVQDVKMALEQSHIDCIFIYLQSGDFRALKYKVGSRRGVARDIGMDISARKVKFCARRETNPRFRHLKSLRHEYIKF
jgi:hypothetical protein